MIDGNTAALNMHMAAEDRREERDERLERTGPDFTLEIIDSITAPCDPYDFVGYATQHPNFHDLCLVAAKVLQPDLDVTEIRMERITRDAHQLMADFKRTRNDELRKIWKEKQI